jgi:peptide/nickel transport system ATP-binding protein
MTALVEVKGLAKTFDVSAPWLNRVLERQPRARLACDHLDRD